MVLSIAEYILTAFFAGFLSATAALPFVIRFARRYQIVDVPGERRIHSEIIPRAGGLAVFFGAHFAACVLLYLHWSSMTAISGQWWFVFFLASSFAMLVGLVDDVQNLRPLTKLSGQTVAALIMVLGDVRIESVFGWDLPVLLSVFVTVVWFLFATNIFNLIDGLDGLATGLGAIAALGLAGSLTHRELYFEALLLVGFIGASAAFFRVNRYPARVFLGDTGSNFIGFFLAAISLETGSKSSTFGYMTIAFLALSIPIFDTFLAVWRRSNRLALSFLLSTDRPGGIMSGDLEHLHHRLLNRGLSQRDVVAFLHLANALLVLAGLLTLPYQQQAFGIVVLTFVLGVGAIIRFVPLTELNDTALAVIHALAYPSARVTIFFMRMCSDALILGLSLAGVITLLRTSLFLGWIYSFLVWESFPFLALTFAEFLAARERMPKMIRLRFLSSCFFLGCLLSYLYVLVWHPEAAFEITVQSGVFALIAYSGIMSSRIFWVNLVESAEDRREVAAEDALKKKAAEAGKLRIVRP